MPAENRWMYGRAVFEEWDQDIFLQYCGIETKPKFIPTAMKCTMEQFQSIHPILEAHGKRIYDITNDFDTRCYLVNNHDLGITNLHEGSYYIGEARVRCETWDGDLFLKNCGINVKQNKENMNQKSVNVSVTDMMKIHNVACDTWKNKIMRELIFTADPLFGTIIVTQKQIDAMFNAATPDQVLVLEEVFGKKEIEWDKIKTGSKVMIEYIERHCFGIHNIDTNKPVDVVFWKTPHYIIGSGEFCAEGRYSSYCTFHQNGNYVLFASQENTDYVIDVVEY
jgi:hypothetical protein